MAMRLCRLMIQGWVPVFVEEAIARKAGPSDLKEIYEDYEVDPYALEDLVLRLVPATKADIHLYSEGGR